MCRCWSGPVWLPSPLLVSVFCCLGVCSDVFARTPLLALVVLVASCILAYVVVQPSLVVVSPSVALPVSLSLSFSLSLSCPPSLVRVGLLVGISPFRTLAVHVAIPSRRVLAPCASVLARRWLVRWSGCLVFLPLLGSTVCFGRVGVRIFPSSSLCPFRLSPAPLFPSFSFLLLLLARFSPLPSN